MEWGISGTSNGSFASDGERKRTAWRKKLDNGQWIAQLRSREGRGTQWWLLERGSTKNECWQKRMSTRKLASNDFRWKMTCSSDFLSFIGCERCTTGAQWRANDAPCGDQRRKENLRRLRLSSWGRRWFRCAHGPKGFNKIIINVVVIIIIFIKKIPFSFSFFRFNKT